MSLGELVVRGLNTVGTMVTGGLGHSSAGGTQFPKSVAGSITMVGTLTALYVPSAAAEQKSSDIAIDVDVSVN